MRRWNSLSIALPVSALAMSLLARAAMCVAPTSDGAATRSTRVPATARPGHLPIDMVQPCWSPDGKYLAYGAGEGGQCHVWIASPPEWLSVPITDADADCGHPVWSPDGARIAISVSTESGTAVELVSPSGGERRRVYVGRPPPSAAPVPQPGADREWVAHPQWSPSGGRLLLERTSFDGKVALYELLTVSPEGADPQVVALRLALEHLESVTGRYQTDADGIGWWHAGWWAGQDRVWFEDHPGTITLPLLPENSVAMYPGTPARLVRAVLQPSPLSSQRGSLLVAPGGDMSCRAWPSPDGAVMAWQHWGVHVVLSAQDGVGLALCGRDGRQHAQLAAPLGAQGESVAWAPDSRHVAFSVLPRGSGGQFWMIVKGA
jgi:hypothetical protein